MTKIKSKPMNDFTKEQLETLAAEGQVIDVRSKLETIFGKVKGAHHLPLTKISTFDGPKNKTYYVYCASGQRSMNACRTLSQRGYTVVNLAGGIGSFKNK
ncbi:rhodanese-like domain-containing protein [Phocicoccus pinnipedialis]|uniref:Thiosulfate sulfurtransferase GlpE n=1 Tax=Phocicoccus pinnipedialis TaxID=110845 RepID=A0A6V7R4T8_9BACL|nr:rhodanese-like domain-containing protein [Jeotgalicoccus pinnipedialis]MBP1939767.1 rhodanese-related sulfurtransferase [Jeotgalicoccus pinnipedialis]CAD2072391.1 Thiosulfate sulfurtransferase GlpE [Jeotgalicoccus pinnipedialis]